MSGHITSTSRGSSVGSSSSRPSSTSRSTSTWRADTVAGVHLDRPVAGRRGRRPAGRDEVGGEVALEPAEQGVGQGRRREVLVGRDRHGRQGPLELPRVAAEAQQEGVTHPLVAVVGAPVDGTARSGQGLPQGRRRVWQPDMDVTLGRERVEQVDLGDRQPGVPEEREPHRQVERLRVLAQPRHGGGVALQRRRLTDPVDQAPPELGLPGQVGGQGTTGAVGVAPLRPVGDQRRALTGVRREESRQPTCHGEAPAEPQVGLLAGQPVTEVPCERARPGLVEAGVDDVEQRPGQGLGGPRVVVAGTGDLGDQRAGRPEGDSRAHSVAVGAGPQQVGEPLGEPPLHPAGGYDDQLARERVGERREQQPAETVGQRVGAQGPVQVEAHGRSLCASADTWVGPDLRRPPARRSRARGSSTAVVG